MEYRSVYITCKDQAEARRLGQALVLERLAACVNYFPIRSIYRWRGQIEESAESALIAKTRLRLVEDIIQRVKELHSYQNPCIVSWKIEESSPAFLDWIKESTEQA